MMPYATQSDSDCLLISQSRILGDDSSTLDNRQKTTQCYNALLEMTDKHTKSDISLVTGQMCASI